MGFYSENTTYAETGCTEEEKKGLYPSGLRCQYRQSLHRAEKVLSTRLGTDFILPEMGAHRAHQQHEEWAVEGPEGSMGWTECAEQAKRKSYNQRAKVWPLARPLVVKSMLTISPCKFVECM